MEQKEGDKHSAYKDDPDEFGASSETAGGGPANHYDGSGPESGSTVKPSPSTQRGNNHGSQEDWRKDDSEK